MYFGFYSSILLKSFSLEFACIQQLDLLTYPQHRIISLTKFNTQYFIH